MSIISLMGAVQNGAFITSLGRSAYSSDSSESSVSEPQLDPNEMNIETEQEKLDYAVAYIKKHINKTESTNVVAGQKQIDLIKACRELVNCPDVMITSISGWGGVQLRIMPKSEYEQPIIFAIEHNTLPYSDTDGYKEHYNLRISPKLWYSFYLFSGNELDELKKLFKFCESKKIILQKPLKNPPQTNVDKKSKLPAEMKAILFAGACMIGSLFFAPLIGFNIQNHLNKKNDSKIKEQIEKQVKTYEESLPGYLEQKQQVDRYRDSLMLNNKIR